jgi:glycosyl transferase family 25
MTSFNHYIISSTRSPLRRKGIKENFLTFGIEPRFYEAVMGDSLSREQLQQAVKRQGLLTMGEIGCALSHLGIYRNLLTGHEPYVFILEDDARITADFVKVLPQLAAFMNQQSGPATLLLYRVDGLVHPVFSIGQEAHILHSLGGTAAHGYVLNRQAARNILAAQTPLRFEIDAWAIYQKLGLISLYSTDRDYVKLDGSTAAHSTIDQLAKRRELDPSRVRKIKALNIRELYDEQPFSRRCMVQLARLRRHLEGLYYHKQDRM